MLFPMTMYSDATMTIPADLRIVGKGGVTPTTVNTNASNYTRVERRSAFILGGEPVKEIWVAYWGGYLTQNNEVNAPNSVTVGFALEYNGVTMPFAVQDTATDIYQVVTAGSIKLWGIRASAFGLSEFPADASGQIRFEATGTAGFDFCYPTARYQTGTGLSCNGYTTGTTQLLGTGALTGGTDISTQGPGPHGIFGTWSGTPDISIMMTGDSIPLYKNDVQDNGTTGGGTVSTGLRSVNGRSVPFVKYAVDGFYLYQFVASKPWFDFIASKSTHLIGNGGGNDVLSGGRTVPQTLTALSQQAALFKSLAQGSKYVAWLTVQPATTGPFTSLDSQNPYPGTQAIRIAANDGMDAFVIDGTIEEVLDTGRAVFQATNTDLELVWPANMTADGIHPNPTIVNTAASTIITPAVAGWS